MISLKKYAFRQFKKIETRAHELNYLFWECTTRCNLNCIHCGSDCAKDSTFNDMPLNDFLKAIDTIEGKAPNFTIVFTGGEPLLRNDLEQCGKELRRRGFRWSMVSNGHLYNNERHYSLLNAGMGALTISLDGLEASHNWMRNNSNSFQKVLNAIELAASSKRLNFDVVTCVNQKNINELRQIKDLLLAKNVKAWRLFTIIPIGRAANNPDLQLTDKQFVELMDFIAEQRKSKDIDVKFSCEGYVGKYESLVRDSSFFCRAGINIGSVLIDGSISACPNIDRSFAQGNIYTDNFYEVWQNKFQPFRNRNWTKTGQCKSCREYKDCQGNGFHNWHGNKQNVLVCHHQKIEKGSA
ncbi:TIGR04133 family radical SAM/SPASM protein [Draconibacterium sediminis]|uniref:Radical SAM protein n=1 Tax=Draconibacterium sediminis TaxID=1544798 RepID=A0A0D8JCH3_9BACT|nr:TIGR04133 family radical SAM/SPASM protein [Draconibacterium sediminis]KJF44637.1 radical SAM protein [Draconibacterium sediminis]